MARILPPIHVVRLLRVILVLGACLHLTGGHFGVLQCIAWAGMIVDYSAQDGLWEGARKTFDGAHPCELCSSIAAAKKEHQEKQDPTLVTAGLSLKELPLPQTVLMSPPPPVPAAASAFADPDRAAGILAQRPPAPPPRA